MRGLYLVCAFAFAFYSGWRAAVSADAPLCPMAAAVGFVMAALHAP